MESLFSPQHRFRTRQLLRKLSHFMHIAFTGLGGKFVFATAEVYDTPAVSKQQTYCSTIFSTFLYVGDLRRNIRVFQNGLQAKARNKS